MFNAYFWHYFKICVIILFLHTCLLLYHICTGYRMTNCDPILWNYSFDSKHYSEFTDPADLSKAFWDIVPEYLIPAFRPNSNLFLHQDYSYILSPILTTSNTLYDFPISVEITYLDVLSTRRQSIIFSKYHNFLSLYNHSNFIKMHMHNAWLLRKSDLTIDLPSIYFTKPKYVLCFVVL